jgi:trehalose-6-phosphatase
MGVSYENGNINTPVIVLGDDPTDENNVLVSRLATAVSVPKTTVSETEGTPDTKTQTDASGNVSAVAETTETDQNAEG